MKTLYSLDEIQRPFPNAVVAIGNFDGVHLGHQAIFQRVRQKAREINGTSVAMTFDPHPVKVLGNNGSPPLITLLEQKIELIEALGVDVFLCVPFDQSFAAVSAHAFLKNILIDKIGMKALVIGKDYTFGKNRKGNVAFLRQHADEYGFEVIVPDWVPVSAGGHERVSSTRVRRIIEAGRVADAKALLGRYYQIRGQVVTGRNRGGPLLGIPTANIKLADELCPKTGVYAVMVQTPEGRFKGVANIGYSPTFDDHLFTVEVHLLDFNKDLYGTKIRVDFIQRIRGEKKFNNFDELKAQIRKDIEDAAQLLPDAA
ncbi:riboflavin kinase/FMN adenylyltransferase [Desulfosalsimonas propionicica]|uniref:Riboflavin biosynthesis protein n=1 Tax=Desulfosalsimonas propionicica TaxID=332175 RepID=A0A7W0C7P7_9BACT|nr:bifunctional riboflavin kinase/FAD synthetase [Desulfosalsimonas propionicica]MBA2880674.1 riboflavin kinase/FMN adenylyltransferase [Desulfosalsimonas propionicica]